jgi:hypothetical protein
VNIKIVLALALLPALCLSGCKKPETPPPAAPVQSPPKPSREYTDGAIQAEYEAAWHRYFALFDPPRVGENLLIQLRDGSFAGGEVKAYDGGGVVLKDGQSERAIARNEIAPESLAELYPEDFARREALAEVEESLTFRLLRDPLPLIGSLRYMLSDNTVPRGGPGDRYNRLPTENVNRGTLLQVKEQKGLWIRVEPPAGGDSFWLPLLATRPAPNSPSEDYTALIVRLQAMRILAGYNSSAHEATMERAVWIGLDPGVREGLARMLAAHATASHGTSAEWIEIKDAETGRRLARYSQAQGFRQQ